jgi:hypothetical protein
VDRLTDAQGDGVKNAYGRGMEDERARIRAAVEALWTADLQEGSGEASHKMVDRDAVLASIGADTSTRPVPKSGGVPPVVNVTADGTQGMRRGVK